MKIPVNFFLFLLFLPFNISDAAGLRYSSPIFKNISNISNLRYSIRYFQHAARYL